MKRSQEWWDCWFLGLAKYISTASKDPSTQVGAVIVDSQRRIVSTGYNGFPRKIKDREEKLLNRELKLKTMIHAEQNAILFASRQSCDCTIYVWPFMPCSDCSSKIIQSDVNIKRVVSIYNENPRWLESFAIASDNFKEADIELVLLDKPKDEGQLFFNW